MELIACKDTHNNGNVRIKMHVVYVLLFRFSTIAYYIRAKLMSVS